MHVCHICKRERLILFFSFVVVVRTTKRADIKVKKKKQMDFLGIPIKRSGGTEIYRDLIPDVDDTRVVGKVGKRWRDGSFVDIHSDRFIKNDAVVDDVLMADGTTRPLPPASTLTTLTSTGGSSLVVGSQGPHLAIKGISAGSGIALVQGEDALTLATTTNLTSVGASAGTSLVTSVKGPALTVKGLIAGSGVVFYPSNTDLTISAVPTTLASSSPTNSLVVTPTGPNLAIRGITAGAGVSIVSSATALTISAAAATATTLASTGGTSLVVGGAGPNLTVRGVTAGAGITLASSATDIVIAATPVPVTTLSSSGGQSLVSAGTGPGLAVKGLVAGTGVTLSSTDTTLTVNATPVSSTIKYIMYPPNPTDSASGGFNFNVSQQLTSFYGITKGWGNAAALSG